MNQEDFAKILQTSRANLSHIEQNKQKPTLEILDLLVRGYNVSYKYIFEGIEPMFNISKPYVEKNEVGIVAEPAPLYETKKGIPLIPISAVAGTGNGDFQVHENDILQRFYVPGFEKADFLIPVKGDSMYPKYYSGDIIACMRVPKGTFVEWNKAYVLDTTAGVMVKRILKVPEGSNWILRSENKEYQDIEVNPDTDIHHISKVIGLVRME